MSYRIEKVGVIGAGTMGASIAAHIANAGYSVVLLDIAPYKLTSKQEAKGLTLDDPEVKNSIVKTGLERAKKLKFTPFMSKTAESLLTLGNLDDNLDMLSDVDWVIEVIVENLKIKRSLMEKIESVRKPTAIITTNTSGLPIASIGEGRSDEFKTHLFGTHFFNPPRYMKLLEIITTPENNQEAVKTITDFCETKLGKGIVYCKDTPNFVGNRIFCVDGSFISHHAFTNGYTIEEVDAITGPIIGRPKTATFRLQDLVGIDIADHISKNLYELIPDDLYRHVLISEKGTKPTKMLVKQGWLGNKTGQGFYQRTKERDEKGKPIFTVFNPETGEYDLPSKIRFKSLGAVRKINDLSKRLKALFSDEWKDDRAAQFAWAVTAHYLSYAAATLPEISYDLVSIDNAMRWGFSQESGPFEMWDMLGVANIATKMRYDDYPVAKWVQEMLAEGLETFYQYKNGKAIGYYDLESKTYKPIEVDPRIIDIDDLRTDGKELVRNDSASILDMGDGVLLLEFHAKMNAIDEDMVKLMFKAQEMLKESEYVGLVVGNQGKDFCVGANIFSIAVAAQNNMLDQVEMIIKRLQDALMGFRYSSKPVVIAPFGRVLGGGCEIVMSGSRRVVAAETYMGLVEVGVGLIPAGGGTKELVRRILSEGMQSAKNVAALPYAERIFQTIGMAKVAMSAAESLEIGFLDEQDRIVMNKDFLLHEAKQEVINMVESGYTPPPPAKLYAGGRDLYSALKVGIWTLQQGGYISEHDALIGNQLANIIAGGNISLPQWLDEQYFLDLELKAFIDLVKTEKSLARIWHMLQTGKPLRN